jgi:DNA-3-methyladenine glycosylase
MNKEEINKYFGRQADKVALDLLGSILIRRKGRREYKSTIVETESYFDESDPASRATKKGDIRETMNMSPGTILIYGIHTQWMLNFVTGKSGKAQGVLIRALEPINYEENTSGPGRLTKVLGINKTLHKKHLSQTKELRIMPKHTKKKVEVETSKRIGVTKDLEKHYRFYIKNNPWVSR